LLCSHHHRLLHEGGIQLVSTEDGKFRFLRSDGRPVEVHRYATETREVAQVRETAPVYQLGTITQPKRLADFPRKVEHVQFCKIGLAIV
ncbi:MAG: hypothetical protein O3A63_19080, partial [Proteobacteria bacterium]|nr:hypothetical protein [Pseudomonadota bacterium]